MKILQIFGAVVAVHLLAFIVIFASPGCQSSPRNVPTPDATLPSAAMSPAATQPAAEPPPTTVTTTILPDAVAGRAEPTRPGSPNAVAYIPPSTPVENIAPVSTYTVQKGDSLWSIAKKNHLTISELTKANNLGAGATLQPGKKLIIPGKSLTPSAALSANEGGVASSATATTAEKAASLHSAGIETVKHTVLPGEKLKTIARKYGIKPGDLAAANGITDPNMLRAGQELIIPLAKSTKPATKSTAKAAPSAADKPATTPDAAALTPHFDLKPPPANQDLDSGLKPGGTTTEVPTVKVEDSQAEDPNKK